jgi:hypothetical protein
MMNRRTQSRFSLLLAVVFLGLTATEALAQARRSSGGRSSVGRSRSRSVGASRRSGVRRSAPRSVGRRSSGMRRGSSARRSAPRASVRSRGSRSSGSRVRSRSVGRSSGRRISAPRSSSRGTVRRGTTRRGNSVRSVAPVRTRSSSPVVRNRSAGSRARLAAARTADGDFQSARVHGRTGAAPQRFEKQSWSDHQSGRESR